MKPAPTGIWTGGLRRADRAEAAEAVAELEALGSGAVWIPAFLGEPAQAPLVPREQWRRLVAAVLA